MGWLFSGEVVVRGVNILYGVLLARIIGKYEYGILAVVFGVITMFTQIASFGLTVTTTRHVALLRQKDPEKAGRCLSFCLMLSFILALLISSVCACSSNILAVTLYNRNELAIPILLGSAFLLFNVMSNPLIGALAGFERFGKVTQANFIQVISLAGLGLLLASIYRVNGAILALALSWALCCIFSFYQLFRACSENKVSMTLKGIWKERRIIWVYGIPNLLTSAFTGPAITLSQAVVTNISGGISGMGSYQAAMSWRRAILFAPKAVRRVTLPFLAKMKGKKDRTQFIKLFFINLSINAGVAVLVALPVMLLSPLIMSLYGKDFANDWDLVIILALSGVFQVLNDVTTQIGAALEKMWWNFGVHVVWSLLLVILTKSFVPIWGVKGYAIAFTIVTLNHLLINTLLSLYFIKKEKFQ